MTIFNNADANKIMDYAYGYAETDVSWHGNIFGSGAYFTSISAVKGQQILLTLFEP